MPSSIYLINPIADFPTYFGAEVVAGWGLRPAACLGDLAITTVAAMAPDDFHVELCDENITPLDLDTQADFIALTGKVSQWQRMQWIAAEYRRRGKVVIIGGPYASLCPEVVGEHCDILVRGEMEEIAEGLFSDLRSSCWKDEYVGTRPELDLSPPGRWDLYPNDRAWLASIQTSRGCPFECEFCDVIEYLGRRQRHKPVANVLHELDEVYQLGYRSVFLADDNFTVVRGRAKELLVALKDWNSRQEDGRVAFSTQLSIDAARDDELLRMCAEAGLIHAFIGIETPNEASLLETKKRQNAGIDLVEQVQKFFQHGILVIGGMIVGFDNDGPDIFERQYDFAMSATIPIVTLGALVAPSATPLHDRMKREGRLAADGSEVTVTPWDTNIVPKRMTRGDLLTGIQWLARSLYEPTAFATRVVGFVERFGERLDPSLRSTESLGLRAVRSVEKDSLEIIRRIGSLGTAESKMLYSIYGALSREPRAMELIAPALLQYAQIRFMYEQGQLWDTQAPQRALASL